MTMMWTETENRRYLYSPDPQPERKYQMEPLVPDILLLGLSLAFKFVHVLSRQSCQFFF